VDRLDLNQNDRRKVSSEREEDSEEKGEACSEEKGQACAEGNGRAWEKRKATAQRGGSRLYAGPSRPAKMAGHRDRAEGQAVLQRQRLRAIQSFASAPVSRFYRRLSSDEK